MRLRDPRPRQPFVALALCAVLGIFAADRWIVDARWLLGLLAGLAILLLVRRSTAGCFAFCTLAFFTLHTLRHHGSEAREIAREFADGRQVVEATGIVWAEPETPAVFSRTTTCHFPLKLESMSIRGEPRPADLVMNVSWAGKVPAYGDRVFILGSGVNLPPPRNPGEFDFTAYQQRQGIYSEIRARYPEDCRVESQGHGSAVQSFAYATSHWIQERLAVDLDGEPEIKDLISSMVLGMRGETPQEMKDLFKRTGTMHLFAVSGLNVAMLAAIAIFLLRPFRIDRRAAVFMVIPLLALYALVTGLAASCVRAAIMCGIVLVAQVVDRRPLTLNGLGAAAFGILAWDTNQLFSPGFQFSFVLVAVIVSLSVRIQRGIEPIGRPDVFLPRELWAWQQTASAWLWGHFAGALGITLSAWIGSLLFTAGYFHLFSPSAIVANMLAVPIAFAVLVLGIATLVAAAVCEAGSISWGHSASVLSAKASLWQAFFNWMIGCFNNANWFCAKVLLWVLKVFALIPGGYLYVEVPRISPAPACEITVLDVNDGGAAHVRAGGCDWLLDCGAGPAYDHVVLPYLRTRGVNRLDGLLLTHGDVKHIGGVLAVLDDFHPRQLADSVLHDRSSTRSGLHLELAARRLGKGIYQRGDVIRIGNGAMLRILYPPAGIQRSVADDKALVAQLESAGTRALFMSDSGFATEQWLIENEPDLRSDIVIKGQHAKDISGTLDFLARVQPRAVVCSALGYGEPAEKLDAWESDVAARGIEVFRQDRCGAVRVEIRDGGFEMRSWVGGQALRSRAR